MMITIIMIIMMIMIMMIIIVIQMIIIKKQGDPDVRAPLLEALPGGRRRA